MTEQIYEKYRIHYIKKVKRLGMSPNNSLIACKK
jgi:hypothetical protein